MINSFVRVRVCVLCNWKFDWSFSLFADTTTLKYCIILKLIDEENYVDIIYGVYFIRRS